jgi:CRP/FNR family cyclic AMP-dependent transcriptional regulator
MNTADRQVFDNNYLVFGLPQKTKDDLAEMATYIECPMRQNLIAEDDRGVDLIVILRGTVSIYKGEERLAEAGPGSVLGEVALVDNLPRSAHVFCSTPVAIAKFDGAKLRKYMGQNRDSGFLMLANVSRVLAARLRTVSQQVEDLMGSSKDPWNHSF